MSHRRPSTAWPDWRPDLGGTPGAWERIGAAARGGSGRKVAAFDADGTLWAGDVGEVHLRLLDELGLVEPPDGHARAFDAYEAACRVDPTAGYALAVELMAGLSLDAVRRTARESWARHRPRLLAPMVRLIRALEAAGVEAWVVSASNRWVIEAATDELGVPPTRVLAMTSEVEAGRLTARVRAPRTNGPGKVEAIEASVGVRPRLAFGNSVHDAAMLDHAELGVLVRAYSGPTPPRVDAPLEERSLQGGWLDLPLRGG